MADLEPWQRHDANGLNDPMVVRTEDLKRAIEIWAVGKDFPTDATEKFEGKMSMGKWFEQETGVGIKRIWTIMHNDSKVTTFVIADKIISAMERPDLMPEVIPNPRWSQERWHKYMEERGCA